MNYYEHHLGDYDAATAHLSWLEDARTGAGGDGGMSVTRPAPERVVIGNATLYHGDCRDALPLLPRVDLLLTDPPYGIGFAGQPTKWQRRAGQQAEGWDDEPITDAVIEALRALAPTQIIWGGNYYRLPPSRGWLVWRKPDAPPSMADLELAWTSFNANAKALDCSISSTNRERVGHPTQKPLRVIAWSLGFAPTARSVLDPFMGSGTTGVACAATGAEFIGIERERRYFDIACERIAAAQAQGQLLPADPMPSAEQGGLFEDAAA